MAQIDKDGWVINAHVHLAKRAFQKHGAMTHVSGDIVHQTGASTAAASLNSYQSKGANGAHFLIDKDGSISQTGSVLWKLWHVGKLRARCLAEHRCTAVETKALSKMQPSAVNRHEMAKAAPDRYPANVDSVGIELVGGVIGDAADQPKGKDLPYEPATEAQNLSLKWLVDELRQNLGVPLTEIFRHPDVSRKNPHEAESARW